MKILLENLLLRYFYQLSGFPEQIKCIGKIWESKLIVNISVIIGLSETPLIGTILDDFCASVLFTHGKYSKGVWSTLRHFYFSSCCKSCNKSYATKEILCLWSTKRKVLHILIFALLLKHISDINIDYSSTQFLATIRNF